MATGAPYTPRAPRLFLDEAEAEFGATRIVMRGATVHRLGRVLRLRRDDPLEVVHEAGNRFYEVRVARIGGEMVEAEVVTARELAVDAAPEVVLCASVIRGPRFDFVVEKATELGAHVIQPVHAVRSLASPQGRERPARWRRLITEAAEQCRRERRPRLEAPVAVADLAGPGAVGTVRIVASERERSQRVERVLTGEGVPQRVEILVGPEGGFSGPEVEAVIAAGWAPVTLGPRPLRAETASVVALAVVQEALAAQRGEA